MKVNEIISQDNTYINEIHTINSIILDLYDIPSILCTILVSPPNHCAGYIIQITHDQIIYMGHVNRNLTSFSKKASSIYETNNDSTSIVNGASQTILDHMYIATKYIQYAVIPFSL